MKKKNSTKLIRSGSIRTEFMETSEPLFLTSGFVYKTAQEAEEAFKDKKERFPLSAASADPLCCSLLFR